MPKIVTKMSNRQHLQMYELIISRFTDCIMWVLIRSFINCFGEFFVLRILQSIIEREMEKIGGKFDLDDSEDEDFSGYADEEEYDSLWFASSYNICVFCCDSFCFEIHVFLLVFRSAEVDSDADELPDGNENSSIDDDYDSHGRLKLPKFLSVN